jgi:ABC-type bacteriocin/lantibiotic exporter with double-glycine peptidase domain
LDLTIRLPIPPGAGLWLNGASGAGKSSLLGLLTGAEVPQEGGLFIASGALPPRHVSPMVAIVPQFHYNHVFTGSLA